MDEKGGLSKLYNFNRSEFTVSIRFDKWMGQFQKLFVFIKAIYAKSIYR